MKRSWKTGLLLFAVSVTAASLAMLGGPKTASAANPTTVSFQGKVVNADGTNVTDGTYTFLFKLYTAGTGGTAVWTETDSLPVVAGVFQVNLGANCSFFTANACNNSTPIDFSASNSLYLGMTFNGDAAGEMSPRAQLQSVPYAYYADNAGSLGGRAASGYVQLTPSSQQTGTINISGNGTFGGTLQGVTVTATGALQGNSLSVNSGALAVNSAGAITASTGLVTTGTATIQQASYTSNALLVNDGQLTAPPAYPNSYLPALSVITSQTSGSRPLFFGYNGGTNYASFLTAGACGSFAQMCVDLGAGATVATAFENIGTQLKVGGGDDGNFSSLALLPGGGTTTIGTTTTVAANGEIYGSGFDYFDPSLMTGATSVGSGGDTAGNLGGVFASGAFIGNADSYSQEFVASLASATTNNRNVGDSTNWYFNNNGNISVTSSDISTQGGYLRMTTGATTNRGALLAFGATAGTLDKPLNAANLPIIQEKVRPSIVRITDDFFWGAFDTPATATATNDFLPTNGFIFATNNSTGTTGWTGIVRKAGANAGTVTCPGTIGTNFATGRIIIVNSTTARFFMDNDATDGVSLVDCGTVTVAAGLPTVDMSFGMHVAHTTNTTSNFDMDYARWWQDDAPAAAGASTQSSTDQNTALADISSDDTPAKDAFVMPAQKDASQPATNDDVPDATPPDKSSSTTISINQSNDQSVSITNDSLNIVGSDGQTVASIDNSGNANFDGSLNVKDATLSGGLYVGQDSTFAGLSTFQKLATFLGKAVFKQDVAFAAHVAVSNDSAGRVKIAKGQTTAHVTFQQVYDNAPVVTASVEDGQFVSYAVANVTKQGFDVTLQTAATRDTNLAWTAVGLVEPPPDNSATVTAQP